MRATICDACGERIRGAAPAYLVAIAQTGVREIERREICGPCRDAVESILEAKASGGGDE